MQNNNFNINDDDFVIGKGFTVDDQLQKKKRKSKRSSTLKTIIWLVSILAAAAVIVYGIIYVAADITGIGFGRSNEVVQMDIPQGATTAEIADKLEEVGAVKMPLLFRFYSKFKGFDSSYKYGLYTFTTEAGYASIADMLVNEGAKAKCVKVVIPEGTGINDYTHIVDGEEKVIKGIATILEEKGVCTREDFLSALYDVKFDSRLLKNCNVGKTYYSLEGYLFPDTYEFYAYDSEECARMVVDKLIKNAESKITDDMYARANELGLTMNEVLTMASIIQMESGQNIEQMPNVAAVFYNRLDSQNFTTLGSSPTCYYGGSFKKDDGRYDTYKIKDLPPGPLCSPGLDAINAALYPSTDKEGYFYFVTDKEGKFYFHKTLAEQNATINRLQQDENWVYETFE